MQTILDQAKALGEAIAQHPRTRAFFQSGAILRGDDAAKALLDAFQKQAEHVRHLEDENKPVEVADKRKLADLQSKMATNDNIKTFMRVQADYIDLMNRVNRAMEGPLMAGQQPGGAPAEGAAETDA